MGFLWGENIFANTLVFTLIVYSYAGAVSITTSDTEESQDEHAAARVELYENSLQKHYQTELVKMIEIFGNMSENLSKIQERMSTLETVVKDGQEDLKKEIASVSGKVSKLELKIPALVSTDCAGSAQVELEVTSKMIERNMNLETEVTQDVVGPTTEITSAATENSTKSFVSTESPLMTSTDCGGILEVAEDSPSTIRYPNGGNYRKLERCVWTLSPQIKFESYRIKVQSFGMTPGVDGVIVYFWNSTNADLQSQKITEFGSWISIPAPYALITFCSSRFGVGAGFEASIHGVGISSDSANFKPFWLTNLHDSFSYPQETSSAVSNEIVSVVVQPPPNLQTVRVSVTVPQINIDTVKLYRLKCHHDVGVPNHDLGERQKDGSNSSITYGISTNYYPFVVIYKSNTRNFSVGFNISY